MPPRRIAVTPMAFQIVVDGVRVVGEVTHLLPNDMTVAILSPFSERTKSLHVPAFAMYPVNRYASLDGAMTPRGHQRARMLLKEIYRGEL